jgi:chemotaxis protein CheY-P-specific phosphatase CheC
MGEIEMNLFNCDGSLEEDVEDILYELGNVGVGMVSTTLGQILKVRVEIGIPVVTKADDSIMAHIKKNDTQKVGIFLDFANTLSGSVLVLLDMDFVKDVVEVFMGEKVSEDKLLTDKESISAIGEFAHVVVASYMNAMGSYTGIRIYVTPVEVKKGMTGELIKETLQHLNRNCSEALCVNTGMLITDSDGERLNDVGHIIMMPDDASVAKIVEAMDI